MDGITNDARMRLMIDTLNAWYLANDEDTVQAVTSWLESTQQVENWRGHLPSAQTETFCGVCSESHALDRRHEQQCS